MELRFDYVDPKEDTVVKTRIMQLANDASLYDALETMVEWCMQRRYRVKGWTIQGRYGNGRRDNSPRPATRGVAEGNSEVDPRG